MSNLKNILQSFHQRSTLNPKIWKKSENEVKMNTKVREKLLEISKEFIEFLKVDIVVSDIIMTGSLSNFNWSNFSDVDLHIIVDFKQFKETQLPLYEELFKLKKTLFNDKHDITIYGYDVELYVQDESESHFASGVFSVLKNEWITKPKKEKFEVDTKLIKTKAQQWMKIIDGVIEAAKDEPIGEAKRMIQKYKEKIKKYRTCGLEKKGEYSDENLVFKTLRRNNYIQKLFDFDSKNLDKKLSLKEATTNIGGSFKTDLDNGPKNHASRGFGNWQSDNAWDIFSPPGTVVNSYTEGTVSKIRDTGKNSGKVFGTQVSVKGEGKFPDIFYTHLKDVKLKVGDTVKVGDYIGVISDWVGHSGMEHVHIGLPYGKHIRELLVNSDIIFSGKESEPKSPDSSSDKDFKLDNETNTSIISSIKKLMDDSSLKDLPSKEKINSNLEEIVDGENKVMRDFYTILKNKKDFKNLQGQGTIPIERGVELLQTGLQYLGFLLPKWGVDGKFGNETEDAVRQFEKKYDLNEDGVMSNEDLTKLFSLLVLRNFKDTNMSSIKFDEDPSASLGTNLSTGNVELKGSFTQAQRNNIAFLIDEMKKIGITNPYTQIGILSVIGKETGYIPKSEVSYAGTPNARIRKIFGSRVANLSDAELDELKRDERKFFNLVYSKTVGNQGGNDGFMYRGRGFNQLTGIKNYQKYSNMIGMGNELVQNPDLLNKPEIAAKVALAFFTKGKSPSTFPNFTNKEEAATYFADINAGGGVSSHRSNAVAASEKFGVKDNIS